MDQAELRRLAIVIAPGAFAIALAALVMAFALDAIGDRDPTGPGIGDHWHAPYSILIGDELQPRIQEVITQQGVHTHGDGVIHLHPHVSVTEGGGAALEHFFGDQGGKLSNSEMQIPGRKETYKNGDEVNGKRAELRILRADSGIHPLGANFNQAVVACDSMPESEFEHVDSGYVPKDGDCIRIVFGSPEDVPAVQPDRTIIDPSTTDREVQMVVSGSGPTTVFSPSSIDLKAGETVKVVLTNNSNEAAFHGLRFSGADSQYGTSDDFVLSNIDPGVSGELVIRFDAPGEYEFRTEQALEGVAPATGKVVVGEAEATSSRDWPPLRAARW
jgi:plastocyanin